MRVINCISLFWRFYEKNEDCAGPCGCGSGAFCGWHFCGVQLGRGSSEAENAIGVPKFPAGKIIKNKVVSVSGGDSGYVEYLVFTSGTGGQYYLYRNGAEVKEFPEGSGSAVPESFSYNPETGGFSVPGGMVSSYMFNAKKDGKNVAAIAKEELDCVAQAPALLAEWKGKAVSFVFGEDSVEVKPVSSGAGAFSAEYTVNGGWITVLPKVSDSSGLPLFYSSSGRMFYLAYETERSEAEAVGKSAAALDGVLELALPVFILAESQL